MHDLDIVEGDENGAVEVTSAADPESIQLWKLLNDGQRWIEPQLNGGWMVGLTPTARAKRIRDELPALLATLEGLGVPGLRVLDSRGHPLVDVADDLGIVSLWQSGTDYPGSIYITIELPTERSGGMVDESGDHLARWVGGFLSEPAQADVRAKLGASGAAARHAFVILPGFSTAPFPVADTLMGGSAGVPDEPPSLPAEITHVWVATTWSSGSGLRWSPGNGWARFELESAGREP